MKTHLLIVLVGLPALLVVSCTIEKRVHLPGYHIERTSQHAWKKREQLEPGGQVTAQLPESSEQPSPALQPEPVPETIVQTHSLAAVPADETAIPAEQVLPPVTPMGSPEVKTQHVKLPFRVQLPGSEKTLRQTSGDQSSVSQADSRNRAGLLLAPIRLLFTILLIALVIVGVVLLFVLESALGGTVLLIAGAVLLILILL